MTRVIFRPTGELLKPTVWVICGRPGRRLHTARFACAQLVEQRQPARQLAGEATLVSHG